METAHSDARTLTAENFHGARKFVATGFGRIAYVEAGEGPVALLVHGVPLNGFQWRHQLAALSDMRRVIAPDSMGLGYTEMRPGQPLGMKNQAAMLKAFLDALGIDQVDLVGNDSGGGASQIFAANNPSYVRTLTLTNCEVHDYDEDGPASVRLREAIASGVLVRTLRAAAQDPAVGKAALAPVYLDAKALPDEAILTYIRPLVESQARIDQMLSYFAATTKKDLLEIEDKLRALDAPVQVLWGTKDAFFPLEWAYWLKNNLRHVDEVVEVEGAPVLWPEERPDLLNRQLRAFWTRHERARLPG